VTGAGSGIGRATVLRLAVELVMAGVTMLKAAPSLGRSRCWVSCEDDG
jgi:NAD(P)-dependent dehydrogenase (short-subunit alcohol dehydrogenase family)